MEFPRLVFRNVGDHPRHGGTYSVLLVENEVDFKVALKNAWFKGLMEAVDASEDPNKGIILAEDKKDLPPTRKELEIKAKELKIKFNPMIGDTKLSKKITDTLKD